MEEIVIYKETIIGIAEMANPMVKGMLLALANSAPSITDLQRQAFDAGRSAKMGTDLDFEFTYPSFDDYQNREK